MKEIVKQYGILFLSMLISVLVIGCILLKYQGTEGGFLRFMGTEIQVEEDAKEMERQESYMDAEIEEAVETVIAEEQPSICVIPGCVANQDYTLEQLFFVEGDDVQMQLLEIWNDKGEKITEQTFCDMWDSSRGVLRFAQSGIYHLKLSIDTGFQTYQRRLTVGVG